MQPQAAAADQPMTEPLPCRSIGSEEPVNFAMGGISRGPADDALALAKLRAELRDSLAEEAMLEATIARKRSLALMQASWIETLRRRTEALRRRLPAKEPKAGLKEDVRKVGDADVQIPLVFPTLLAPKRRHRLHKLRLAADCWRKSSWMNIEMIRMILHTASRQPRSSSPAFGSCGGRLHALRRSMQRARRSWSR